MLITIILKNCMSQPAHKHSIDVLFGYLLSTADCVSVDTINTELVVCSVMYSVVVIVLVIMLLLLDMYIVII